MAIIDVLKQSIIEELTGAESEYKANRCKNALILYSKALFSMCDYIIIRKNIKLPENHDERFRILERYFPSVYDVLNSSFKKYTDTYLKPTDKESCIGMKNAVKKISRLEEFDKEIKSFIEKI